MGFAHELKGVPGNAAATARVVQNGPNLLPPFRRAAGFSPACPLRTFAEVTYGYLTLV